jgi:hypothetical protein
MSFVSLDGILGRNMTAGFVRHFMTCGQMKRG